MERALLLSIKGPDRVGVVSAVTSALFDSGCNLADTSYAVLGQGFEFTCILEVPNSVSDNELNSKISEIDVLEQSTISLTSFPFSLDHAPNSDISHMIELIGGDRPGLIARVSEALANFDANIVYMSSRRIVGDQSQYHYKTRFDINLADSREELCENAIYNTAGSLNLQCIFRKCES
jgi:glycine cleavage system transcriptional repressor